MAVGYHSCLLLLAFGPVVEAGSPAPSSNWLPPPLEEGCGGTDASANAAPAVAHALDADSAFAPATLQATVVPHQESLGAETEPPIFSEWAMGAYQAFSLRLESRHSVAAALLASRASLPAPADAAASADPDLDLSGPPFASQRMAASRPFVAVTEPAEVVAVLVPVGAEATAVSIDRQPSAAAAGGGAAAGTGAVHSEP